MSRTRRKVTKLELIEPITQEEADKLKREVVSDSEKKIIQLQENYRNTMVDLQIRYVQDMQNIQEARARELEAIQARVQP